MKRILIYFPEDRLAPIGGPAGYLYNLQQELKDMHMDDFNIAFLPANDSKKSSTHAFLKKYAPTRGQEFVRALKMSKMYKRKNETAESYFSYDAIHFHSTEDLYYCRDFLDRYTGKVLLTSHTPCASFYEKMSRLNKTDRRILGKRLQTLKMIDEYAFKRADYVLFPCEQAEEPYYHTWSEYANIRVNDKYRYIPSGIRPCYPHIDRNKIRERYGIPQDAYVVSYVGRHNEIKGYADLKEIGKFLLHQDVWFLIAGNEMPIKGLQDKHWIEVGWTNDPYSIVNAADVFILPNKETYFDLVLLEILSLGQIVIASNTGGNKYFKKFPEMGLFYYNTLQEAVSNVQYVRKLSEQKIANLKNANASVYHRFFTTEVFTQNYISLLKGIFNAKE